MNTNELGAHLNPGISLALATTSKFPWIKLAHYIPAQYLGSFVGTVTVYGIILNFNALNFAKKRIN